MREPNGVGGVGDSRTSTYTDRLRTAVEAVNLPVEGIAPDASPFGSPVRLDEDRLAEVTEAWVPVRTPHGPGILVWSNSD